MYRFWNKGHTFSKENTYLYPISKKRVCLICRREYDRNRRPKKQEKI